MIKLWGDMTTRQMFSLWRNVLPLLVKNIVWSSQCHPHTHTHPLDLTKTLSDVTLTYSSCSTPLITVPHCGGWYSAPSIGLSGAGGVVGGVMFIDLHAGLGVKGKVNLFSRRQGFLPLPWLSAAQSIAHYCASSRRSEGKENWGNFLWRNQLPN